MSWPAYHDELARDAEYAAWDEHPDDLPESRRAVIPSPAGSATMGTPDRAPVEGGPAVGDRAPSGPAFPKPAGFPSPPGRRQTTPRASSPVSSLGDARGVLLRYHRFAGQMADCHPGEPAVARVDGLRACTACVYGPEENEPAGEDSLHV